MEQNSVHNECPFLRWNSDREQLRALTRSSSFPGQPILHWNTGPPDLDPDMHHRRRTTRRSIMCMVARKDGKIPRSGPKGLVCSVRSISDLDLDRKIDLLLCSWVEDIHLPPPSIASNDPT